MALPTYQGVGAGNSHATTGNLTVAYPASLVRNDYLILQVTVRNTTTTVTTPDGWSVIWSAVGAGSTTTGRMWIFGKKSEGTESGSLSVAFGTDAATCKMGRMYFFRNVDVVTPYEGGATAKATGTTVSATSLTTSGTDRLGLHFLYVTDDNAVGSFTGEAGGDWTETVAEFTTTQGSDGCIQLQSAGLAAATTISGGTYAMAATDPHGKATVALRNGTEQRYVWDNIGVTDALTATLSIDILNPTPPIEGIAMGETVSVNLPAIPLEINIYDGIALADTENVLYPVTVIVGEVVTVLLDVVPTPSQGVAVGETVAVNKDIVPSVYDGIGVAETIVAALSDPSPAVIQGVEVGETVTAQLSAAADLTIDLSQGVGVSDVALLLKDVLPSVYDGIDASEAVVVSLGGPSIIINENVGTAENVSTLKDVLPSVFDGVVIGETVDVQEYGGGPSPNVYESIGVTDVENILYPIFITVTESVTVSFSDVSMSVQDTVEISENTTVVKDSMPESVEGVGVSDIAFVNKDVNPSLYDGIGVAETLNVVCAEANNINVYEGISVADVENILYPITIVVGETVAISWITYPGFLYNYERIGVSESVEIFSGGIGINVHDNIGVHEANYYVPFIAQNIGTSDIATVFFSWLNLNAYETVKVHDSTFPLGDQITITEVVTVALSTSTVYYPNVSDMIGISEYIDIEGPELQINLVENIGLSDVPEFALNLGDINLFDSIGLADFAEAGIVESEYLAVNVWDNAGMQESLDRAETLGDILKTETIGLRDLATVIKNLYATVADSIGLGEFMAVVQDVVAPIIIINSPDSIGISEVVSIFMDMMIEAIEGIDINDTSIMAQDILVDAYDVIGIAESMELLFSTYLSKSDAIGLHEYINLLIDINVSAVQGVGLREYHDVELEIPGLVGIDKAFVGEYIAVRMFKASGRVNVVFDYKKPNISMSHKKPDITFDYKQPVITFAGE